MPTDRRLKQYRGETPDLGREELMFQYGRYLLIPSSREGGLPADLQGKWNQSNDPPWHCDYHTDVNVEMNYWLDRLKSLPDGTLVTPPGLSPEHGPVEGGISFDQQLVWDLFTNTIEAADALGTDREFPDLVASKRAKLLHRPARPQRVRGGSGVDKRPTGARRSPLAGRGARLC